MAGITNETGFLFFIGDEESGNKNGKGWSKRIFVIRIPLDKKEKFIAFTVWGDKINELLEHSIGDKIEVMFSIDSTLFNNKWYTNLVANKIIEIEKGSGNKTKPRVKKEELPKDGYDLNETTPKSTSNFNSFDGDIEALDLPF